MRKLLFLLLWKQLRKVFSSGPSLVGQFLDKPLPYYLVKKAVDTMWKQFGKVEVFLLENGMFIFRFADEATRDEVLTARLWHISNKPLVLRRWEPRMQLLKLSLTSIPIWIKLLHLPMEFWTPTCLSYVASGVGKPLYADSITEDQERLGFARVLVEVHTDSTFPREILLKGADGRMVPIAVEYPWIPVQCKNCKSFGHAIYSCPKVEKKVWVPKACVLLKQADKENNQVGRHNFKTKASKGVSQVGEVVHQPTPGKTKDVLLAVENSPAVVIQGNQNTKAWPNSFEVMRNKKAVKLEGREIQKSRMAITAIQKIIEDALYEEHSRLKVIQSKGKEPEEKEDGHQGRGFSPSA
jgi:hypothetical protein